MTGLVAQMDGSMICLMASGGLVLLVLLAVALNYNGLVRTRNHVLESWADVDTELKRRYDLIPNLVETVKGYARHERDVLERVTQARTQAMASSGTPGQQAMDENFLVGALRQIFALSEGYPELKSDGNFLELQKELTNTEDRIQAARRFYNGNVRELNNRVQMFPSSIIARMFDFQMGEYFEVEESSMRRPVDVTFGRT